MFVKIFEILRDTKGLSDAFKPLPVDTVQKLQLGRPNGVGFLANSSSSGRANLIIDFEERGICSVRVKEADEASMQKYFELIVLDVARQLGTRAEPQEGSVTSLNGYRKTFNAWIITPSNGQRSMLALTTLDRPGAFMQHFMTFGFINR